MFYAFAAYAALLGAAGVASAAAGAHSAADPRIATMAQMLMVHAAAAIGILALGRTSAAPTAFLIAVGLMLLGITLFSGDLAMRVYANGKLFPMAAPIGGSLTIASWVATAIAAILAAIWATRIAPQ